LLLIAIDYVMNALKTAVLYQCIFKKCLRSAMN
jgi:hypothetical protein